MSVGTSTNSSPALDLSFETGTISYQSAGEQRTESIALAVRCEYHTTQQRNDNIRTTKNGRRKSKRVVIK